jgi:hypothetical protein
LSENRTVTFVFQCSFNKFLSPANDLRVLLCKQGKPWCEALVEDWNLEVGDLIRFQTYSAFLDTARIFLGVCARPFQLKLKSLSTIVVTFPIKKMYSLILERMPVLQQLLALDRG